MRKAPYPVLLLNDGVPRNQEHGTTLLDLRIRFGQDIFLEDENHVEHNRNDFILQSGKTYWIYTQVMVGSYIAN